ncbi:MAG TPA: hypothetical protein VFB45_15320 [Pseudolabrys sp.]|nr:hypothetical protein [Pseudolabrys sp.]
MDVVLPDRETAVKRGWTHQVQWIDDGKPCFVRCRSGREADARADRLKAIGAKPVVFDLRDALQLH